MQSIILKNESADVEVTVNESNAGVPRVLTKLKPGGHYSLKYNPDATYREYIFVCAGTEQLKVVSSDDFNEYKEIKIFLNNENMKYDWVGIRRGQAPAPIRPQHQAPGQPPAEDTSSKRRDKCLIL